MGLSLVEARQAPAIESAIVARLLGHAAPAAAAPLPSLAAFIAAAWPLIEPATPFIGGYHIDAIVAHLEAITQGTLHNLIINIPPRHTKSSLVAVLWPVWEWLHQPSLRAVFASYGLALSIRDSLKRRRLIESSWFRAQWGARFQLTSDQNMKSRYENDRTGVHIATSVGGVSTGEGGERLIVDDPHHADEIESGALRQAVLDWWDGAMATRGNQPHAVARVIVMQRLHERDLVGHLLERMAAGGTAYDHLVLPAEYEPRGQWCLAGLGHDPRTERGQLLSPARFDAAALATLTADLGAERAAGQLQQRPAPPGGALFHLAWWDAPEHRYDPDALGLPDAPRTGARFLFFDTAFKRGEDNDYTACSVVEVLADYRLRWREVWAEKVEFPDLLERITDTAARWNADDKLYEVVIEDTGSGTSALQTLGKAGPLWLRRKLAAFMPTQSKEQRARQAAVWCKKGAVLLPHPRQSVPWLAVFERQVADFPRTAHDDSVDSLSMGVLYLENYLARWELGQPRGGAG